MTKKALVVYGQKQTLFHKSVHEKKEIAPASEVWSWSLRSCPTNTNTLAGNYNSCYTIWRWWRMLDAFIIYHICHLLCSFYTQTSFLIAAAVVFCTAKILVGLPKYRLLPLVLGTGAFTKNQRNGTETDQPLVHSYI